MNEDPLRLVEMGEPPGELIALVRRMHGPPPMPPDLSLRMRARAVWPARAHLWIVGPTLALVTFAGAGYVAYRVVVVPAQVRPAPVASPVIERREEEDIADDSLPLNPHVAELVDAVAAPEPVIVQPSPVVEERPRVVPPHPSRPRVSHAERTVEAGRVEPVVSRASGRLVIQSMPWSRVFLDGRDTHLDTPVRDLPVEPGHHRIGLRTEDGTMHTTEVDVRAGETLRIVRSLGPARSPRSSEPARRPLLGSLDANPF